MTTLAELNEHREIVIKHVRDAIIEQGGDRLDAVNIGTRLYFAPLEDLEDLYKCLQSDTPDNIKHAIIAHDVNGLVHDAPGFLPKSRQFREAK